MDARWLSSIRRDIGVAHLAAARLGASLILSLRQPAASADDLSPDAGEATQAPSPFEALGISARVAAALSLEGITMPFPVQARCIPDVLAGRDVSVKAHTGSGKTLAFGLPLLERTQPGQARRPRALVLAPTRELVNQITDRLAPLAEARGLWISAIYGGVSMQRQINALRAGVEVVVATPGRLNDLLDRNELSLDDVGMIVIDEADQMADMGFLPQVSSILDRIRGPVQTLLFSATLDGAVGALVRKYQHDPVQHALPTPTVEEDPLEQRFIGVRAADKLDVTAAICRQAARAIVFVKTTRGADRLVRELDEAKVSATAMHGRMAQNKRERSLAAFRGGASPVLVATNVAARGIDVSEIDVVIHYDPPEDEKVYLHRSGRTARAGRTGMVVTLVQPEQSQAVLLMQHAAHLDYPIVGMRPDDERLAGLYAWTPPRGFPEAPRPRTVPRQPEPLRRVNPSTTRGRTTGSARVANGRGRSR